MNEMLTQLRDVVVQTFRNPAADLGTTGLVLAIISVFGLIVITLLMLAVTPSRRRVIKVVRRQASSSDDGSDPRLPREDLPASPTDEPVQSPMGDKPSRRTASRWFPPRMNRALEAQVIVLLVLVAIVSGYLVTGTRSYCSETCHASQESVTEAARLDHASCVQCHEGPGLSGVIAGVVGRGSMIVAELTGTSLPETTIVDSRSCLRCHRGVLDGVIVADGGTMISHAEPISAGYTCSACHGRIGHGQADIHLMSVCLGCHNGDDAPANCETCHSTDPYDAASVSDSADASRTVLGGGSIDYPLASLRGIDCGGCHDQEKQCDTCHGLRMPHPQDFIDGGHARYAAFEKKEMCYKCHEPNSCSSGCHLTFPGHGDSWKYQHQQAPWDSGCGCHQSRSGRQGPMCVLCHDT